MTTYQPKLTLAMITALNYYATRARTTEHRGRFDLSHRPRSGTADALVDRELLHSTAPDDRHLTEAGRALHRALFAWVADANGEGFYLRRPTAAITATAVSARELATAEGEAYAEVARIAGVRTRHGERVAVPGQSIDVDTLVRAALNALRTWDRASDVVDQIGRMVPYLIDSGVSVTCDGRPYQPTSLQSWGRFVAERGLLADHSTESG